MNEIVVIGAGPAGVVAALRAADLGAKTTLVTRDAFGGMAANDGPIPVRTLAHAARLMRNASELGRYGIETSSPQLNYSRLLTRVREVVADSRKRSIFRPQVDTAGVTVHENVGIASFVDANTVETTSGLRLSADKFILCTGGISRPIDVPGAALTNTHSDAWILTSAPPSMIVVGAGATGVQVASIFNAFGTRIQLFQAGRRIVPSEDEEVSAAVADGFRKNGIDVREDFGKIDSFEKTSDGIRMNFTKDGNADHAEATLAIMAIGWIAKTAEMQLVNASVSTNTRGFIDTNDFLQTSNKNVFAAGDATGRMMLVPQAIQHGFIAATNAILGNTMTVPVQAAPIGSFTDPEYAQVGMTETKARESHEVVVAKINFNETTRTIIDNRTFGFVKLIVDRTSGEILGCHIVGERAVDLAQVAAVAISANMKVYELAQVPLSFPTYAGVLGRAAAVATQKLERGDGYHTQLFGDIG